MEWIEQRITSGSLTLKNGWIVRLVTHLEDLVIGGIKFCKEEPAAPIISKCYTLGEEKTTQGTNLDLFRNLLYTLGECKGDAGGCAGYKLCGNHENHLNCSCFAGFSGEHCNTPCEGIKFGLNCASTSNKHCLNDGIDRVYGDCIYGCALGYKARNCENECTGGFFGKNCAKRSLSKCLDGTFDPKDGKCLGDCSAGYKNPPECVQGCTGKSFGKHCSQISNGHCKNGWYNQVNGKCVLGCAAGYKPHPDCDKSCQHGKFGENCMHTSMKNCIGNEINPVDGNCLKGNRIQTVVPKSKNIESNAIVLDLAASLRGKERVGRVLIQYKEKEDNQRRNASEELIQSNQNDSAVKEELCRPMRMTVLYNDTENVLDEPLDDFDFQKSVTNCKCGEHKIELKMIDSLTLYSNYTCTNCQSQRKQVNQSNPVLTSVIISLLILAALATLAIWLYLRKSKKSRPLNELPSVQFFNNSNNPSTDRPTLPPIEDQAAVVIGSRPKEPNSTEVERYLLSALAGNFLKDQFEKFPRGQTQSWDCGSKPENKSKNRYKNLAAYDSSRVKLELLPGDENSDYINANYVDAYERPKAYIAGQGPTANTLDDFWRMVWQEKVSLIVMVTNLVEGGKKKCEKYWPDNNQEKRHGGANLVDNWNQYEFAHLVLLEIIANPKFEISCDRFTEEYNNLKANNKKNLKESFSKLKDICERDFQRVETPFKNETDKCRYPEFISSSSAIARLFPYENVVTTSFINAVTVDGYQKAKQFIATQVPMKNTVADFWRMIDQFNVKEIIVLNEPHISEGEFLPSKERRFIFGEIEVILDIFNDGKNFKTMNIQLETRGICKKVNVKRAYDWKPGKVAPSSTDLLIELWDSLKMTNDKDVIAVVCHDGVTACGLFLGIGFVIEKIKLENKVDVGLAVRTLRKSRPAYLSSEMQYELVYETAQNYLYSFDTYGNFNAKIFRK
ncbi:Hypothetical predicted protein [Cloeon dipterum]|uniref:protein-tyrosine-phosphatase n=1 Tax=Cloeon dipterum TaxID=197152 RepID=A0A8S1CIL4_9INSE|nr:Hypothetical predicted protein [Cloeon dipterum]